MASAADAGAAMDTGIATSKTMSSLAAHCRRGGRARWPTFSASRKTISAVPGIPPERVAEALRRGGRLDQSGAGAGLGLAIVSDILEAWSGSLELGPTAPGAMTATVRLPLTRR